MTADGSPNQCSSTVAELAARLVEVIRGYGPAAVAYSGGVDSAVVARATLEAHGETAVAVTAVSPSLAESERQIARLEAQQIGIRHIEISTREFDRPEYRANASNRCFFCKDTLYRLVESKLSEFGVHSIVNGANVDDLGDHRPGMRAAAEYSVRSPLIEAGLGKDQVRQLARYWNLTVAEKPASPCLSSRIAYGVEVTEERVHRVELAEAYLRNETGLDELRVRLESGELARVEVPLNSLSVLITEPMRSRIIRRFRELGFQRVTVDLEGFRSGSLNDSIQLVALSVGDA